MTAPGAGPQPPPAVEAGVVIDSMAVGFLRIDRSWRITQLNAAAERILGRAAALLVGHDLWSEFPGARELEFGRVYEAVMITGRSDFFEAYYPGLDIWFELRVQPVDDGIACYFLDVTARHLADERAARAAERVKVVADVAQSLTASLDVTANVGRLARLVVPYLGDLSIVSVVDDDGNLTDAGCWHVDPERRESLERFSRVRLSAFEVESFAAQAARTGRAVVLTGDAHASIRERMRPGEARDLLDGFAPRLCALLPMVARGRTVGLLTVYADSPWSDDQYEVARDIAARAALSIDNSLAYSRARVARAEAEAAGQRLTLLAQVGEALTDTDDPDEAVGRLARLVVPQLADWSMITVIDEDDHLRVVGWAHRDSAREPEVAAYAALRSEVMSDESPVATALRLTEPVIVPHLSDEALSAAVPVPEVADLARRLAPHGVVVIPLTARGRTFGELTLVTTHERGSHTEAEIATALEVARRAGPVLESARAARSAHQLAESMQRSVLAIGPAGPGVSVATRYRPAYVDHEVGGDWYDTFALRDGSTVITIGDVMGHDVAAIAAMAQLRTFMRAMAWTGTHTPAQVLTATDDASFGLGPARFATAMTGELRPVGTEGSVELRWANAGHLPPALVSPDGAVSFLAGGGADIPLGVVSGALRRDRTLTLSPGSVLLLYTDGLVERRDRDIEVGLAELAQILGTLHRRPLDELLDTVLAELTTGSRHNDDIALLALRVDGDGAGPACTAGIATPPATVELDLGGGAAAAGRHHVAAHARGLPAGVGEDAELLVSELISNALRHGLPPVSLTVVRTATSLRVAVTDHGPALPVLPAARPQVTAPSGRGLLIVAAIAADWGVDPLADGSGKTVWFDTAPVAPLDATPPAVSRGTPSAGSGL